MNGKVSDQNLVLGEDGEEYRWFLLPSEASLHISGMKPVAKTFKMPFFPRTSVKDSRIRSRAPSKSVYNPHICATCGGASADLYNERKEIDGVSKSG